MFGSDFCWCLGFLTCAHMLMHAIAHGGCTDTVRVCTESWLWEKNPLSHRGLEPESVLRLTFQSHTLPTELFPARLGCVKSTIHYAWLYCVKVCCVLLNLVVLCEVLLYCVMLCCSLWCFVVFLEDLLYDCVKFCCSVWSFVVMCEVLLCCMKFCCIVWRFSAMWEVLLFYLHFQIN